MKCFIKYLNLFLLMFLTAGMVACGGGGGGGGDDTKTGSLLSKITPLLEESIPKYTSSTKGSVPLKSWSANFDPELGEDSYVVRYFGDDGNSVFTNAEEYDFYADKLNTFINTDYTSADSRVTISSLSSFTILGTEIITGDFHDVYLGTIKYSFDAGDKTKEARNIHILFEKKEQSERAYLYYETFDVYTDGTPEDASDIVLFTVELDKDADTIVFNQYKTEEDTSSGASDKTWLRIDKFNDDTFLTKETNVSSDGTLFQAIATGDINTTFLIRTREGNGEGVGSDECFRINSSDMTKSYPDGDDGSAASWTEGSGGFPATVADSIFITTDNVDSKIIDKSSLKWFE